MPKTSHATWVLVGTTKGLFRYRTTPEGRWTPEPPVFSGTPVYTTAVHGDTLFAAVNSEFYGPSVYRSRDGGDTWETGGEGLRYESDAAERVTRVWAIEPAPREGPGVLYAGVEASGLFRSEDDGHTWQEVPALRRHPTYATWEAGYGGKCLHTIVRDPYDARRLYVAASTGGVYRSDDGGDRWRPVNRGIRASFLPADRQYPESGQCVHRVAASPVRPGRLWLQNHGGVYRSDDGGETWMDVSAGLPASFGFAIVAHPTRADTALVVPLESDGVRFSPGRRFMVARTDDAGATWRVLTRGLPDPAYTAVLRDALSADPARPGVFGLGTTSGSVFVSEDEGESWQAVAHHLPRVLSVRVMTPGHD
jgi:photosystem II stability/assembly factor-like uncharacterized protein